METQKRPVVALFDLDIIAYRASAAVEKRSVKITHEPSGKSKVFKTVTEWKTAMKAKDKVYNESDYSIEDIQTPEPAEHAYQIVKVQVNTIKQEVKASRMEGFVGKGDTNFRLDLELPDLYKGQRETMLRPIHLAAAKKYALDRYPGGLIQGIEADDYLVIRSHELEATGNKPVIITLDKDAWGCVGTRYYDWTQPDAKIIEVPAFGYLDYDREKKKMRGLGLNFFCYQLLAGDNADNYSIKDLHKLRFGDVSVFNVLKDCKSVDELFAKTEDQYKEWFPEPITYTTHTGEIVTKNYKELLELYFKAAYMHRVMGDKTTFYSLWEEFSGK